jgi:hypothetical protein
LAQKFAIEIFADPLGIHGPRLRIYVSVERIILPCSIGDKLGKVYLVDAVVEVPVEAKVHGMTSDVTT